MLCSETVEAAEAPVFGEQHTDAVFPAQRGNLGIGCQVPHGARLLRNLPEQRPVPLPGTQDLEAGAGNQGFEGTEGFVQGRGRAEDPWVGDDADEFAQAEYGHGLR